MSREVRQGRGKTIPGALMNRSLPLAPEAHSLGARWRTEEHISNLYHCWGQLGVLIHCLPSLGDGGPLLGMSSGTCGAGRQAALARKNLYAEGHRRPLEDQELPSRDLGGGWESVIRCSQRH